jgi:Las17-binding protein actin regulator
VLQLHGIHKPLPIITADPASGKYWVLRPDADFCFTAPLYFKALGGAVVRIPFPCARCVDACRTITGLSGFTFGRLPSVGPSVSWLLLQGFTVGYEAVDSLIVIDTADAVKAFTTSSFSIDADVGMGIGKLAGQVTPFSLSSFLQLVRFLV